MNAEPKNDPTEQEIRDALIRKAKAHCETAGISLTELGRLMNRGKSFFSDIEAGGRNFTVRTYAECMAWFDQSTGTPKQAPAAT